MITIIREIPEKVNLYCSNNKLIGTLNNEYELLNIQIQICEQNLSGYYIVWNNEKIVIDNNGNLLSWPQGMYSKAQELFRKLLLTRKNKRKHDENLKK